MRVVGVYSFNKGQEVIKRRFRRLFNETLSAIKSVDAATHKQKISKEKTMQGRMLYSPSSINSAFKQAFQSYDWSPIRVRCDYPSEFYVKDYKARSQSRGAFREMDFVKNRVGIEVQFGKYAFMVYNVCAKMTIFRNLGYIDCGIEIVPVKAFADEMSTGVSYFEQFVWDLEKRGVADIDVPVFILGIDV